MSDGVDEEADARLLVYGSIAKGCYVSLLSLRTPLGSPVDPASGTNVIRRAAQVRSAALRSTIAKPCDGLLVTGGALQEDGGDLRAVHVERAAGES